MSRFKAFLKSFTPYQKWYLIIVFALTMAFVIFLPDMMLDDTSVPLVVVCSVIATLANPLCEIMISKQSIYNFWVDFLLIEVPSLIVYISLGWYALCFVTMLFWIPIDFVSIHNWKKHPDREEEVVTVVKTLTPKQDVLIILAIAAFTLGIGTLISRIPGASDSYLDALAAACGMSNGILLAMRYKEQWFAWIVTLVFYIILDIRGGAYIMLIKEFAMVVNTCYGFWKWKTYISTHKDEIAQEG
ncbi:MAG: nicotinamide mononucleotide transporter [Firmicutes bacterium]|nr:nicotinamide mononucleotide transporter [Bacillota bacterium]MBR6351976.1 nicotinamide mononucleotide transporter [Bacillota bacterium]